MSFEDGNLYEQADKLKAINGELCEEINRQERRIRELESLVRDMFRCISHANHQDWFYFERDKSGCGLSCAVNGESCGLSALRDRMTELGIEVGE